MVQRRLPPTLPKQNLVGGILEEACVGPQLRPACEKVSARIRRKSPGLLSPG